MKDWDGSKLGTGWYSDIALDGYYSNLIHLLL
jgi:hypothetical protein